MRNGLINEASVVYPAWRGNGNTGKVMATTTDRAATGWYSTSKTSVEDLTEANALRHKEAKGIVVGTDILVTRETIPGKGIIIVEGGRTISCHLILR